MAYAWKSCTGHKSTKIGMLKDVKVNGVSSGYWMLYSGILSVEIPIYASM